MALVTLNNYQKTIIEMCLLGNLDCFPKLRNQLDKLWIEEELCCLRKGVSEFRYLGNANNRTSGRYKDFVINDAVVWFNQSNSPKDVELTVRNGELQNLDIELNDIPHYDRDDFEECLQIDKIGWRTYEIVGSGFKEADAYVFDSSERNFDGGLGYLFPTH